MHTDKHGKSRVILPEEHVELQEKDLTEKVIGASLEVINELGAGFLESVYLKALMIALADKGLKAEEQRTLKVKFREKIVGDFVADILVEDRLVLELKAAKSLNGEHEAQVINYLKATGMKVGLLINFGRSRLEWKRLVF